MATIDNLTLEITANTNKAVDDLHKLSTALSALKDASKGISSTNLNKVADAFSNIRSACSTMSLATVQRVERLANALGAVASVDVRNLRGVASAISRIGTTQSKTSSTSSAQPATQAMNATTQAFQATASQVNNTMHNVIPANATNNVDQHTMAVNQLIYRLQMLKSAIKLVGWGVIKQGLQSIGDTAKRILAPIQKMIKALGRIALYRAIRGLLKNITQGIKEGIENLAQYSKALNEMDSAKANYTMSQLATEFLYLKNSIASAIMPIIQGFVPAIQSIIDHCVSAINVINQLISALQGKATFTRAKVYWVDYADQLDKTGKKAKALHHQLAGFDELNNLTAPSASGGKSELDPTQMFEEANIDTKIFDLVEKMKENFEKIKDYVIAIGAGILAWTISNKLANALSTLGVLSKTGAIQLVLGLTLMATGFTLEGMGIADIFTKGIDLSNFGKTVGGALLASVGSWITGNAVGALLAPVVASLTGLSVAVASSLVMSIIGGLGTAIAGIGMAVAGIWSSVVEGIDWLSAILTVLGTTFAGAGIGAIVGAIVGALGGPIGAGVGALIGLASGAIIGYVTNLVIAIVQHWDDLKAKTIEIWGKITTFFSEDFPKALRKLYEEYIPYAVGFIIGFLNRKITDLSTWLAYKTIDFVTNTINRIIALKDWLVKNVPIIVTNVVNFVATLPERLEKILANALLKFLQWSYDAVNWAKNKVPEIKDAILYVFSGDFLEDVYDIGKNFIENIWNGMKDKGVWLFTNISTFFKGVFDKISDNFSKGFDAGYSVTTTTIPAYADGGFVRQGNLFIANERGAEMVGSINGHTAVANNDQITSAIAQATYSAMAQALSENGGSVNIVVEGDGDKMFKVWQKKRSEYERRTGMAY